MSRLVIPVLCAALLYAANPAFAGRIFDGVYDDVYGEAPISAGDHSAGRDPAPVPPPASL